MSDRLPWFRCFPSALLGAIAGMQADEGFTFITVLLRIYETGGPVAETSRTLSRRTGLTERKVLSALDSLFAASKLIRLSDGRLDASSTHDELDWQKDRHVAQSNAGKVSASKRSEKTKKEHVKNEPEKSEQNQQNGSTSVQRTFNHKEEDIEEYSETTSLHTRRVRKHAWPANYRDVVWAIYPKKADKKESMEFLDKLFRGDKISFETITAGIARLSENLTDAQYAPALHRWLRKERWNDEFPASGTPPPQQRRQSGSANYFDIARQADDELRNSRHDSPFDGSPSSGPSPSFEAARNSDFTLIEFPGSQSGALQQEDDPFPIRSFGG